MSGRRSMLTLIRGVLAACFAVLAFAVSSAPALAGGAPQWSITVAPGPASFAPGSGEIENEYTITAVNTGGGATDGTPVRIADVLPAGLTAFEVGGGELFALGAMTESFGGFSGPVSCEQATVSCTFEGAFDPGDELIVNVFVAVDPSLSGSVTDTASVTGGGASAAQASSVTPIGAGPSPFGFAPGSVLAASSTSQAGAHPNLTVGFTLARASRTTPVGETRDVQVELPPGLAGSATATPRCTMGGVQTGSCPSSTMVGVATVAVRITEVLFWSANPVYSITPYPGEPAAFGFFVYPGVPVRLDTSVRSGSDYGTTTTTSLVSTAEPAISTTVTLWGVPGEHNGPGQDTGHVILPGGNDRSVSFGGPGGSAGSAALFTNPTDCGGGPLSVGVSADSWAHGSVPSVSASASAVLPAVTGCGALQFQPSLRVRPETTVADSPSGVDAQITVPQDENPDGLATPELRDASVTLPVGASLSPGVADGLQGCTPEQFALHSTVPATCPAASQIGTASVTTPALPDPLEGEIFVGTPECSPCTNADAQSGALAHGYLQVHGDGVIVKVAGSFLLDPVTGQITARFLENPQLPFSDLKLHFKGGPRGALATPEACGVYETTSTFTPWSAPETPLGTPFDNFPIQSGCVNGFAPGFTAGSTNTQAGGYSPFTVSFSRGDTDQELAGLSVSLPPGLLGKVAGVPLCPDANANAGTCPEASLVGTVRAGAGPGPAPFFVSGKAYLTGPYKGGPYGLVVEVPAVAGPFDLGTVVVRQSLRIDPHTAQVSAVSDAFPTILDGIPLRVRRVDVTLDRPGFMFNPTSCAPMAIVGVLTSTGGLSASVSSRFQVGGCGELPFHPSFTVSTQAGTSKANGASLDVRVGPSAGQANIAKVAVTLPKQLPSRLTTIQQACPEATFAQNPAGCPAGSNIGTATAVTPVLAGPVVGPAYLVSHGGAAFPDLVVILQGDGVTLDLVGSIDIKHGVTSSAFDTIPDAPISSFELTLPEGPHSGLTTNLPAKARGNLCGTSLTMPTTITGQNGAQIKQSTRIAVTGCPKAVRHARKKTHRKKK